MASRASISILTVLLSAVSLCQGKPDIAWLAGGHIPNISAVAYSSDGQLLASSGHFGDGIKIWDSGGNMLRTLPGSSSNPFIFGPMLPIRFTPDRRFAIAVGEGSAIGVWSVQTGKLTRVIQQTGGSLDLSPNGSIIALASGANVKLLDFQTGTLIRTLPGSGTQGVVDFSPDGTSVVAGDLNGNIRVWRVNDGLQILSFAAHAQGVTQVEFNPSGTIIGSASSNGSAALWNAQTGLPIASLIGHTDYVSSLAFAPDGTRVATGSWDQTLRTWHVPSGAPIATLPIGQDVYALAFHPTSDRLAVGTYQQISERNGTSLAVIRDLLDFSREVGVVTFSPDSSFVAAGSYDNKVSLFDCATGALIRQIPTGASVFAQDISPDGTKIAVATNDQQVKIFRISDGALLGSYAPGWYAYAVAWSPDGQIVADGNLTNEVHLRRASDQVLLATLNGHTDTVTSLAYTPDGTKLLSGSEDGTVRVWSSQGGFIRALGPTGRTINSIDVSTDGQYVLAGTNFAMAYLWRISDGALIYSFSTGVGSVNGVKFSPNGKSFYTSSSVGGLNQNAVLAAWRTADRSLIAGYSVEMGGNGTSQSGPQSVSVSPNGRWIAYGRDDATMVLAYNTVPFNPQSVTVMVGSLLGGTVGDLRYEDENYLTAANDKRLAKGQVAAQIDLSGTVASDLATSLAFTITASASTSGLIQELWLKNRMNGTWELLDSRTAATADSTARVDVSGQFGRFVGPAGEVEARLRFRGKAGSGAWTVRVDRAVWLAGL